MMRIEDEALFRAGFDAGLAEAARPAGVVALGRKVRLRLIKGGKGLSHALRGVGVDSASEESRANECQQKPLLSLI